MCVSLYRLAEAEERYSQRDSRPEDLELIQQLREEVQEREMRVKQLIVSTPPERQTAQCEYHPSR